MYRYLAVLLAVQIIAILFNLSDDLAFPTSVMLACDLVQVIVLAIILEKMPREDTLP